MDLFAQSINPAMSSDFDRYYTSVRDNTMTSRRCVLNIYTPVQVPYQVLRSHLYNFTENFVDRVTDKRFNTTKDAVGLIGGQTVPDINKVVTLDPVGQVPDFSNWGNFYTFTMIIDLNDANIGGRTKVCKRIIASGYFLEEPMVKNRYSTISQEESDVFINPNAHMRFTHVTDAPILRNISTGGSLDGIEVTPITHDYSNDTVPMYYSSGNMYVGTPGDLALEIGNNHMNGTDFLSYDNLNLNHMKQDQGSFAIDSDNKSPRRELLNAMSYIDDAIERTVNESRISTRYSPYNDNASASPEGVLQHMGSGATSSLAIPAMSSQYGIAFDFSKPMSIQELNDIFGDSLHVIPSYVGQVNQWCDVKSQVGQSSTGEILPIGSAEQLYSALAADVIPTLCSEFNISHIKFSYRWVDGLNFNIGKNESFVLDADPSTNLGAVGFIVDRSDADQIAAINAFKYALDWQLFSIIHDACGSFEIHVMCDIAGPVLINLVILDNTEKNSAYYYTDNKLGGLLNPSLATRDVINNNYINYMNLANVCGMKGIVDETIFRGNYGSVVDTGFTEEDQAFMDINRS